MSDMNSVTLTGRITRDIEMRHTPSGVAVADIGLAVNDKKKQGDQWMDVTHWVDVTVWGRTAEIAAEYAGKGSQVGITGRLQYESWEDSETRQKRNKLKVVCDKLTLLGSKSNNDSTATNNTPAMARTSSQNPVESEVPF